MRERTTVTGMHPLIWRQTPRRLHLVPCLYQKSILDMIQKFKWHLEREFIYNSSRWSVQESFGSSTAAISLSVIVLLAPLGFADSAHGSIPLDNRNTYQSQEEQRLQALLQLGIPVAPLEDQDRGQGKARQTVSLQQTVTNIMASMEAASDASRKGDFLKALGIYTKIVNDYPDLAVTERARISRGLILYQVGEVDDALLALEDEEVVLRGSPEVNAALSVIIYAERPRQRARSETLWAAATSLDGRWSDVEWVEKEKGWPPRMISALQRFLSLT